MDTMRLCTIACVSFALGWFVAPAAAEPRRVAVGPSVATWTGVIIDRASDSNQPREMYADLAVAPGLALTWFGETTGPSRWRPTRAVASLEIERWLETKNGANNDLWALRARAGAGVGPIVIGATLATGLDACGDTSCGFFRFYGLLVEKPVDLAPVALDLFGRVDWDFHVWGGHPSAAVPITAVVGVRGILGIPALL